MPHAVQFYVTFANAATHAKLRTCQRSDAMHVVTGDIVSRMGKVYRHIHSLSVSTSKNEETRKKSGAVWRSSEKIRLNNNDKCVKCDSLSRLIFSYIRHLCTHSLCPMLKSFQQVSVDYSNVVVLKICRIIIL